MFIFSPSPLCCLDAMRQSVSIFHSFIKNIFISDAVLKVKI